MAALGEAAGEVLRARGGYELADLTVAVPPNQLLPVDSPAACVAALDRIDFQLTKRPTGITVRQASAVIKAMLTLTEAGERLHLHAAEQADDPSHHEAAAEHWRQAWIAWRDAYTPLLNLRTTHPERGPVTGQALLVSEWVAAQIRPRARPPLITSGAIAPRARQWSAALASIRARSRRIADDLAQSIAAARCLSLILAPNQNIERGPHAAQLWAPLPADDRLDEVVVKLRTAGVVILAGTSEASLTSRSSGLSAEAAIRAVTNVESRPLPPEKNRPSRVSTIPLRTSATHRRSTTP